MFDRISRSFSLALSSWNVLKTDKHLALFPLVSGIACFAILITFAIPLGAIALINNGAAYDSENHPYLWLVPVGFVYYFVTAFVVVFCNSALVSCAIMRFNGETPTVKDGFRAAWARVLRAS